MSLPRLPSVMTSPVFPVRETQLHVTTSPPPQDATPTSAASPGRPRDPPGADAARPINACFHHLGRACGGRSGGRCRAGGRKRGCGKTGKAGVDIDVRAALFQYLHQTVSSVADLRPRHTPSTQGNEKRKNPLENRDWDFSSRSRNSRIDHDANLNAKRKIFKSANFPRRTEISV